MLPAASSRQISSRTLRVCFSSRPSRSALTRASPVISPVLLDTRRGRKR